MSGLTTILRAEVMNAAAVRHGLQVDDDDLALLADYRVVACKGSSGVTRPSARQKGRGGANTALARLILGVTDRKVVVDHINGDCWDNRRANLRICTQQQNLGNTAISASHSVGYKGVAKFKKRFGAQIWANRERRWLGLYATPEEAARAYDEAAREIFGEFACVNFPREGERGALQEKSVA